MNWDGATIEAPKLFLELDCNLLFDYIPFKIFFSNSAQHNNTENISFKM